MKILLDAMGGDNAPKSTVQGAADAVKEFGDGMTLALLGDEAKIKAAAQELGVDLTPFELIHCTEDVDMHDDPVKAVRHCRLPVQGFPYRFSGWSGTMCHV